MRQSAANDMATSVIKAAFLQNMWMTQDAAVIVWKRPTCTTSWMPNRKSKNRHAVEGMLSKISEITMPTVVRRLTTNRRLLRIAPPFRRTGAPACTTHRPCPRWPSPGEPRRPRMQNPEPGDIISRKRSPLKTGRRRHDIVRGPAPVGVERALIADLKVSPANDRRTMPQSVRPSQRYASAGSNAQKKA